MNAVSQAEIARYVEAVRAALADLSPKERDDLLEDLPDHLAEVAAEGEGSLAERLGPPAAYAAELRASAGLAPPGGQKLAERLTTVVGMVRGRLNSADTKVGPIVGYARASEFLRLLRPAWWVLRGYLAAMVFAYAFLGEYDGRGLLPRVSGNVLFGFGFLVLCVLASIWLGRHSPGFGRWPRWLVIAGSAVVVLAAFAWLVDVDRDARNSGYYYEPASSNPYDHINDVYVYDSNGWLLTGVRLFDQDGQPIQLGTVYCGVDWSESEPMQIPPYPRCPERAPWGAQPGPGPAPDATPEPTAPEPAGSAQPASPAPTGSPTPTPTSTSPAPTGSPIG